MRGWGAEMNNEEQFRKLPSPWAWSTTHESNQRDENRSPQVKQSHLQFEKKNKKRKDASRKSRTHSEIFPVYTYT